MSGQAAQPNGGRAPNEIPGFHAFFPAGEGDEVLGVAIDKPMVWRRFGFISVGCTVRGGKVPPVQIDLTLEQAKQMRDELSKAIHEYEWLCVFKELPKSAG